MRTLLHCYAFVVMTLCLLAGPVAAAVPDPSKSHSDPVLVGNSSGADMGNKFHVNVRDVGNVPKHGAQVSLVFFSSPARPLMEQETGTSATCASPANISRVTDQNGDVFFHARIAGFDDGGTTVQVRASGVLLRSIPVRSTDLNGDGTTDLSDLHLFRERFLFDPTAAETDFNQDGVTDVSDLVLFRREFFVGARGTPCP